MTWRCAYVVAYARAMWHTRVCMISGLSIRFKDIIKLTKAHSYLYMIGSVCFAMWMIFYFFYVSDVMNSGACDQMNESRSSIFT